MVPNWSVHIISVWMIEILIHTHTWGHVSSLLGGARFALPCIHVAAWVHPWWTARPPHTPGWWWQGTLSGSLISSRLLSQQCICASSSLLPPETSHAHSVSHWALRSIWCPCWSAGLVAILQVICLPPTSVHCQTSSASQPSPTSITFHRPLLLTHWPLRSAMHLWRALSSLLKCLPHSAQTTVFSHRSVLLHVPAGVPLVCGSIFPSTSSCSGHPFPTFSHFH